VTCDGAVLAAQSIPLRHGHGEAVLPMIDRVVAQAGLKPAQLGAVAAATGPGGFTGIRVGLAAAQGIALALRLPLIGVSSFVAVAARVVLASPGHRPLLVALDSRRSELYVQLLAADLLTPVAPPAPVLPADLAAYVAAHVADAPLLIAGDASDGAATALAARGGLTTLAESAPDAVGVAAAALRQLWSGAPLEPLAPFYLRPPDVSLPKRAAAAVPVP
jgi:tRNA threonylcarbamoyladenosine biosynthesis protein TsaB